MNKYEDIINLPHYEPIYHSRMSIGKRTGQFAPFAALTGHGEAIAETARLTGRKIELDDYEKMKLDEKLLNFPESTSQHPQTRSLRIVV